jgi:predicted transcriptional regulator
VTSVGFTPHPDDRARLEALVDDLAARRQARGFSQRHLAAAVGVTHAALYYLECRRPANPLVATLQRYGDPLRVALQIHLDGLPLPDRSPAVAALAAGGYLGSATTAYLRQVREHLGLRRTDVQAAHGWKWSSLAALENCDREPLLSTIQRYARCLGGQALPVWEESC